MNVRKLLLVASLIVVGGGLIFFYLPSTSKEASTVVAASSDTAMVNEKLTNTLVVADPAASTLARSDAAGGAGAKALPLSGARSWKRSLASVDMETTALSLLASDQPNDWLQAVSLNSVCLSGFDLGDLSPNSAVETDSTFGTTFRRVAQLFSHRCGELGKPAFLDRIAGVQARAIQAKEPIALAPSVTNATIDKGLSDEQFQRLSEVFSDSESATLWLSRNFRKLDSILPNAEGFSGVSRDDLRVASVVAFCVRGLDCSENSALALQLCVNTGGQVGGLAALQKMEPSVAGRINSAAQRIDSALTQGNPAALGFRRRSK